MVPLNELGWFTLSFFAQFIHPERGSVLLQALQLGTVLAALAVRIALLDKK